MMKTNSIIVGIEKERLSGQSRLSEKSFADDDYQDELIPLKFDDGSQSQSKGGHPKALSRNSSGSLSEISELSVGDKSEDQDLAVNLSFPTGDSDEESDADSRNLIADWEDDLSDVDSLSSGSSLKNEIPKVSSLLDKNDEDDLDDDVETELLLAPQSSAMEASEDQGKHKPMIEVAVPDYVWKSPESLKKKSVKMETPKSAKSKGGKKKDLKETKIDEESLSDGSALDNGSVLSAPQDQIQKPLFEDGAKTPELLSTPTKNFVSPEAIALMKTPQQILKKKLRKKTYLVEEQEDGKISRYNPMFYSESKHAPLVDHSKTKKEKIQAKKQRKKEIREERDRMKDFYKTMDSFAATGLEGDAEGEEEADKDAKESLPTPTTPSLDAFFGKSTEPETDTSTEESSGSYDSVMFDDDYSIGSMDSIEGVTKVKKSSRKKKGKKAKKKATKKKKVVKKRARRADYEPEDDADLEPERPRISIEERVEAIFTNKELIYQSHADVENPNPEDAHRQSRTKIRVKSKAASGGKGSRSRSRSVDRAGRDMARKFQRKRSTSSGALQSFSKRDRLSKRSSSSRSLKGYSTSDDDELNPKSKPARTDSGGSNKLPGKKPRPPRPKPGGAKTRSNSFSAMTTNMKAMRDKALKAIGGEGDEPLSGKGLASSEHVQRNTRGKKSGRGGTPLSKSDHGTGRRGGGGLLSKSLHENGARAPMRGKRPDRLRTPSSKSPARNREKQRDSSKSKSPTTMSRKKLDTAKNEARSPSSMQRKKQLARDESMRKFEEILGKRDVSQSPSVHRKRLNLTSPKGEKNRTDSGHSRNDSSKSPSSMRRKRQEASDAKESSKHSSRGGPDEDRIDPEEKPRSSRKKKADLDELRKSKSQELDDAEDGDRLDDREEKPKSARKKKADLDELRKSKSQDPDDAEVDGCIDPEEKPKSSRKKKSDLDELKKSNNKPDPDSQHPDDDDFKKSINKPDPDSQHSEDDPVEGEDNLKPEVTRVKSKMTTMEEQENEHYHDDDGDDEMVEEEELKPEAATRRKKVRGTIQRTRSRSRDFFDGMVETVKTVKTKTKDINLIKSIKFPKSSNKETSGGAAGGAAVGGD